MDVRSLPDIEPGVIRLRHAEVTAGVVQGPGEAEALVLADQLEHVAVVAGSIVMPPPDHAGQLR